jgi:Sulfotransferase domain
MSEQNLLRLAMWSGPRNISTAMMRSWGNRSDTIVCDEPLYAHYLSVTGRDHPGAAEVIEAGPVDIGEAIHGLLAPLPPGKKIFYQKHMAHHLLPEMDRGWLKQLTNCFLLRDPKEVVPSYIKHVADPTLNDTGYPQQAELFELVRGWTGKVPPVIDARDVLENPRGILSRLCEAVGTSFIDAMLSWSPGLRETDGIWAKYWYQEVQTTSSFQPYQPKNRPIPPHLADLVRSCEKLYQQLYSYRLRA